jgi:outer membrane protein OmpA-like peptidoglycan-associated protein
MPDWQVRLAGYSLRCHELINHYRVVAKLLSSYVVRLTMLSSLALLVPYSVEAASCSDTIFTMDGGIYDDPNDTYTATQDGITLVLATTGLNHTDIGGYGGTSGLAVYQHGSDNLGPITATFSSAVNVSSFRFGVFGMAASDTNTFTVTQGGGTQVIKSGSEATGDGNGMTISPSDWTNVIEFTMVSTGSNVLLTDTIVIQASCTPSASQDFGDAPDTDTTGSYPTNLNSGAGEGVGASHEILSSGNPYLGDTGASPNPDAESDASPNATATGDDTSATDDEEGISTFVLTSAGASGGMVDVKVGEGGSLSAWVDFNANGNWTDTDEQILSKLALTTGFNGTQSFTVPTGAALAGDFITRWRICDNSPVDECNVPTGPANDGEVEDHLFSITPSLSVSAPAATDEGDGGTTNFVFDVTLDKASNQAVSVTAATEDGTATLADTDYVQISSQAVNFAAGDTSKTVTVTVNGDTTKELNETFKLKLSSPSNATLGTSEATATINNDDNNAPTVANAIGDQTATEDSVFSFAFASNTFSDADGDTLTYTATKSDDSALPTWLTFTPGTRAFSGTPLNADVGTLSVKVTADDGFGGTVSDTLDIVVANTNDAPTITGQVALSTAEDTALALVVGNFTISDPDSGESHTLIVNSGTNYTVSGNTITPANNFNGTLTVHVKVNDGTVDSAVFNASVTVTAVNDKPTANPGGFNTDEDTVLNGTLTGSDPENQSLSFSEATSPTKGSVGIGSTTGAFVYTPNTNANGTDSFTFTVSDGSATSDPAIVTVSITAKNDAPTTGTTIPDQGATEDTAFNYTVPANAFADVDNVTLTYTASGLPASGHISMSTAGVFSGTPLNADVGAHSVTVTASDGGNEGTADNSFTLTVTNTNDAPTVANPIADQTATADSAFSFAVPGNTFADVDSGDTQTLGAKLTSGANLPSWLTFTPGTSTFSGTPTDEDAGVLDIRVTMTDSGSASVTDDFTLTTSALDRDYGDAPTTAQLAGFNYPSARHAVPTNPTIYLGTAPDIDVASLPSATALGDDAGGSDDEDGVSSFALATAASGSSVSVNVVGGGRIDAFVDFNADGDWDDVNEQIFTSEDVSAASGATTLNFTSPTIDSKQYLAGKFFSRWRHSTAGGLTQSANAADGEVEDHLFEIVPTLSIADASVTEGDSGTADLVFTVSLDKVSNQAVSVSAATATGGGDPATIDSDGNASCDADLQANSATLNIAAGESSATFTVKVCGDTAPEAGETFQVTLSSPGNAQFTGAVSTVSAIGTITNDDNFLPTITDVDNQSTNEDMATSPISFTVADAEDSDSGLSVSGSSSNTTLLPNANIAIGPTSPADGSRTVTMTPAADKSGTATVTLTVTDGDGAIGTDSFVLTVNAVNDAPTKGTTIPDQSATEDAAFSFTVPANAFADEDGDTLTYTATGLPSTISMSTAGVFSGTPLNADVGDHTVVVTASDAGNDGTATSSFTLTVINTNDAPTTGTMIPDQSATEDAAFSFTVPANAFADEDGDTLTYTATGLPSTITMSATGVFSGTPLNADVGPHSVVVTASDGGMDGTATNSFTLTVTNTNDAPTGTVTINGTATEDETLTATNTLADADGLGTISYQWNRGGSAISGATSSTYVLAQADVGQTLTVTASYTDGGGTSESETSAATAAIANVDDAPTGTVTINGTATEDGTLTVTNTLSDGDGMGPVTYQWSRNGVPITGATGESYTLGDADAGKTITVTASYTDGGGKTESVTSSATSPVENLNDAPVITGQRTIRTNNEQSIFLVPEHFMITDADGDRNFTLQLSSGSNYRLQGTRVIPDPGFVGDLIISAVVIDQSTTPPARQSSVPFSTTITVTAATQPRVKVTSDLQRLKENGVATLTASLDKAASGDVTVSFSLASDSQAQSNDFTLAQTLTIKAGELSASTGLTAVDDADTEDENLGIEVGVSDNAESAVPLLSFVLVGTPQATDESDGAEETDIDDVNGGDGDDDGKADGEQKEVATLSNFTNEVEGDGTERNSSITISIAADQRADGSSPTANAIRNAVIRRVEEVVPQDVIKPSNVVIPEDIVSFDVELPAGQTGLCTQIDIILGVSGEIPNYNAYFKYGKENPSGTVASLYEFSFDGTTGAVFGSREINGKDITLVTLHLCDGKRGDADGIANGVIEDPGFPALKGDGIISQGRYSAGGGGAMGYLSALCLGLLGFWRRRRAMTISLAAIGTLLATSAQAAEPQNLHHSIGGSVGVVVGDNDRDPDVQGPNTGPASEISYINQYQGVTYKASLLNYCLNADQGCKAVNGIGLDALFSVPTSASKTVPYIGAGLGLGLTEKEQSGDKEVTPYARVEMGFHRSINAKWALQGSANILYITDDRSLASEDGYTDVFFLVGLNRRLGNADSTITRIEPDLGASAQVSPVAATSQAVIAGHFGVADTADNCPNTPPHSFVDSLGCPLKDLAGADAVRFGNDLSSLNPIATTKLDKVVALLRTNPMAKARIVGHADNTGSLAYNVKLSERRADSALAYLIGKGISSDRLTKQTNGEIRPFGDNSTSAGRAANRRVEVLFGK